MLSPRRGSVRRCQGFKGWIFHKVSERFRSPGPSRGVELSSSAQLRARPFAQHAGKSLTK